MFGLKQKDIEKIQEVFSRYSEIEQVIIYGSRAKGNFRPGSDIDLTLKGKTIDLSNVLSIENEIDDLLLPYTIDLSVFHHITDKGLIDHIERVGRVFYERD